MVGCGMPWAQPPALHRRPCSAPGLVGLGPPPPLDFGREAQGGAPPACPTLAGIGALWFAAGTPEARCPVGSWVLPAAVQERRQRPRHASAFSHRGLKTESYLVPTRSLSWTPCIPCGQSR